MDPRPGGELGMPSVQFALDDLEGLLGRKVPRDKEGLNEIFAFVKGDVESLEADAVSIEVKDSNRPDIWSVEGIARSLRYQLESGRRKPIAVAGRSKLKVAVDKRVKPIRPYISVGIVKGLKPSEEALKGWISLQEKLDLTYGRKRKRASIGLYQADMVDSPLSYTVADPDETSFAPLGSDTPSSLRQIVKDHPKGSEYGDIISGFDKWPLLIDGDEKILSLPPVINSNDLGKITPETKNVLVEVTGTDSDTVHNTLKIVVACLAERGGRIYSCMETYPYGSPKKVVSPNLDPTPARLSLSHINKLLGTSLNPREAARLAEKAGYQVRRTSGVTLQLEIPCYRTDIMHPVDMIEDIAIAYDLNKLKREWPRIWTIGELADETYETERLGEIMVGLGFQEILTYALTAPEVVASKMLSSTDGLVTLSNPKMSTHTVLRNWLLPSLLEFLSQNTHVEYPQRIFEIGATANKIESTTMPVRQDRKVAAVTIHGSAGFTEMRSAMDALMSNSGQIFEVKETVHPSFLTGRCGQIVSAGHRIGIIGELSPKVLRAWGLNLPAAAFEVDIPRRTTAEV
jgi:phenylalanyl-tRNA synthetase beta chain